MNEQISERRTMAEVKLKPCPFCGGEAKTQSYYHDYAVYCRKCEAATRRFYPTKQEAIEAWNRRVNDG